jgi:hypothetical protein
MTSGFIAALLLLLLLFLLLLPARWTEQAFDLTGTAEIQPRAYKHNCKVEENVDPHNAWKEC